MWLGSGKLAAIKLKFDTEDDFYLSVNMASNKQATCKKSPNSHITVNFL